MKPNKFIQYLPTMPNKLFESRKVYFNLNADISDIIINVIENVKPDTVILYFWCII